jgi:hypothetical protein
MRGRRDKPGDDACAGLNAIESALKHDLNGMPLQGRDLAA